MTRQTPKRHPWCNPIPCDGSAKRIDRASAPYAAAKAGVGGLMRNLALHAGPKGIRINCILPGFVDTEMNVILGEEARAEAVQRTPLRRLAVASDIASMAVVMISDLSSYVHGVELDINGGMYMA